MTEFLPDKIEVSRGHARFCLCTHKKTAHRPLGDGRRGTCEFGDTKRTPQKQRGLNCSCVEYADHTVVVSTQALRQVAANVVYRRDKMDARAERRADARRETRELMERQKDVYK